MVPEAGLEPARPKSRDFKSLASTNFAIRAAICVSFQIQHKIIIHHITSYVKLYLHHFLCGLRERIRTFDILIPNQVLCQTELLGEKITGGMYWIRTNDLLLVREILYQLS